MCVRFPVLPGPRSNDEHEEYVPTNEILEKIAFFFFAVAMFLVFVVVFIAIISVYFY